MVHLIFAFELFSGEGEVVSCAGVIHRICILNLCGPFDLHTQMKFTKNKNCFSFALWRWPQRQRRRLHCMTKLFSKKNRMVFHFLDDFVQPLFGLKRKSAGTSKSHFLSYFERK